VRSRDDATVSATDRKRFGEQDRVDDIEEVKGAKAVLSMYRRSLESDVGAEWVERVFTIKTLIRPGS
jgi:hypothetical protein